MAAAGKLPRLVNDQQAAYSQQYITVSYTQKITDHAPAANYYTYHLHQNKL